MNAYQKIRDLLYQLPFGVLSHSVEKGEQTIQAHRHPDKRLAAIKALNPGPIEHLDIGARSGLDSALSPYRGVLSSTLVEGDLAEAERLRHQGYRVVEAIMAAAPKGRIALNRTKKPALSSIFLPNGAITDFYAKGSDRFSVVGLEEVETTSVDAEARKAGIAFDDVKIDVQGAEMEVLAGMEIQRPFHILAEVSTVQLYKNQSLFYDIGQITYARGYIICDLLFKRRNGEAFGIRGLSDKCRGLPLHGDAAFIPDWTRPEGQAVILRDPFRWASVLIMRGYGDMVLGICEGPWLSSGPEIAKRIRPWLSNK